MTLLTGYVSIKKYPQKLKCIFGVSRVIYSVYVTPYFRSHGLKLAKFVKPNFGVKLYMRYSMCHACLFQKLERISEKMSRKKITIIRESVGAGHLGFLLVSYIFSERF